MMMKEIIFCNNFRTNSLGQTLGLSSWACLPQCGIFWILTVKQILCEFNLQYLESTKLSVFKDSEFAKIWFHVKSEWQKISWISTLWLILGLVFMGSFTPSLWHNYKRNVLVQGDLSLNSLFQNCPKIVQILIRFRGQKLSFWLIPDF